MIPGLGRSSGEGNGKPFQFLPGKPHGWRSLAGYSPRDCKEAGHVCSVTSVKSESLQTYGLKPTRLLCPWASPGKNTGVGCHFLLQGGLPESQIKPVVDSLPLSQNPPAKQESWFGCLGLEDPLKKGMATHSHILAWRIPSTGDWRATLHRIAKSWTRLKLLSMHACMNLGMHVPFSIRVCLHICPGVVFLDHMLILFLVFW